MRTPVFELHIQPMFRTTDREHMRSEFDLWDYDDVVARADDILTRLQNDMPPVSHGGRWPQEWIELFRRWNDGARKRLELGTAAYTFAQTGNVVTVTATGTFPVAGCRGWLQFDSEPQKALPDAEPGAQPSPEPLAPRRYVLYVEPPDAPAPGTPAPFVLKERYRTTEPHTVFVRDATGVHQVH
ncbi:hypothetical protein [Streptomyces sp. NPDC054887]